MEIRFLLLALTSLFSCSTFGQNVDSLLTVYTHTNNTLEKYEIAEELVYFYSYDRRNWDSTNIYLEAVFRLANSFENTELKAKAYHLGGNIFSGRGKHLKADSLYEAGLQYAISDEMKAKLYIDKFALLIRIGGIENSLHHLQKIRTYIKDTTSFLMGQYYFNYSHFYSEQNDPFNSLKYLQKAKNNFQIHKQSVQMINFNMGGIYSSIKAYEQALQIDIELREIAQKEDNPINELFSLFGIMTNYLEMKDYKASKKTCFEAIELKKRKQVSEAFGYVYCILGVSYLKEEQYDSAQYYFTKGIEISELQNEAKELGDNHGGMAELLFAQGKFKEAKYHSQKANTLYSYVPLENNALLSKIYAKEGNYQKAYNLLHQNWTEWEKREHSRRDYKVIASLFNEKFEQEKKQEALLYEQQLSEQRAYFIRELSILGLVILIFIILIQIWNNRKLKQLNQALQNANKKLEQANYELRTFNYIASHDIKEPIRNIGNYAGLIFKKLPDDLKNNLGDYFQTIKQSTKQLYTLIEDFARYTTLSKNEIIEHQPVELDLLLNNVEHNLSETILKSNGKVVYQNLPTIALSSSLLYTVFKNLIENGLKYNQSPIPTVEITYQSTDKHHQIIVSDNGIGIEKQYHDKVFEMFKRLHNRGEYEGSGIGLAIVKLCIDKVRGEIMLESEINKGSRFILSLPK